VLAFAPLLAWTFLVAAPSGAPAQTTGAVAQAAANAPQAAAASAGASEAANAGPDAGAQAAGAGSDEATAKELPEAKPLELRTSIDHPQITLGQTFQLVLDIVHDPADTYALPLDLGETLGKGSLELRGEPQLSRTPPAPGAPGARTIISIPLTDVASMKPTLPELVLEVQGPSGARHLHVQPSQTLSVDSLVAKEGEPNQEHAHHGPKPPEQITVRSYLWLWILLVLAAVAAAILVVRMLRARAEAEARAPPPPEPEDVEAQRRLLDLRRRAPWKDGQGRAAIFELSEIVRTYLGKRLGFNAVDLTSEELLLALAQKQAPGLDLPRFTERVQWEDLVKFAKLEPESGECELALDAAGELVERTRSRLAAIRNADLVGTPSNFVGTPTIGTPTNPPPGAGGAAP